MRQVNDGLDAAFKEIDAQFIDHQCNQQGNDPGSNGICGF
jgi:hypothetical protein